MASRLTITERMYGNGGRDGMYGVVVRIGLGLGFLHAYMAYGLRLRVSTHV